MTKTITLKCLFRHTGVNSDSAYDFVKVFEDSDEALLSAKRSCCYYHDDDRLVEINEYKVLEVTILEGMDITQMRYLQWLWQEAAEVGADVREIPLAWQLKIRELSDTARIACLELLKVKNFRSDFRKSLRNQLESWCKGESAHSTPFSPKQMEYISRPKYQVDRIENSI